MRILGIGTDLVNTKKFSKIIKKNKKFIQRIYTKEEQNNCSLKFNKFNCFAKRFAAKEAFSKALGTGISNGISFKGIEIINNSKGKPIIYLDKKNKKIVKKILKSNKFEIFLSLSDDNPFVLASVIITK